MHRQARGFTLIESLFAVGIAAVLGSVALPSLEGHVQRAKRSDAMVVLMSAQLAEERYRADHARYGSLAEIGVRPTSGSGHYAVAASFAADTYVVTATAQGAQARDTRCFQLRIAQTNGGVEFASGPDATASNPAAVNRKCWNQ